MATPARLRRPAYAASYSGRMGDGLLEVTVLDPRDVPGAVEGGADRLHLVAGGGAAALSPDPAVLTAVCRESSLPVFVVLRLTDSWSTTGG